MHAYIVTGQSAENRSHEINRRIKTLAASAFDITYLEPQNGRIGIDAVRSLTGRLLFTPVSGKHSVGVIRNAELLTTEAQNAILKLLEEPPPHVVIFCDVAHTDMLLPTIVSRCEIIALGGQSLGETNDEIIRMLLSVLASSNAKKLDLIDSLALDRTNAKEWVNSALTATRSLLLSSYSKKGPVERKLLVTLARRLINAQKELSVNVNPKLVLDHVFLSL